MPERLAGELFADIKIPPCSFRCIIRTVSRMQKIPTAALPSRYIRVVDIHFFSIPFYSRSSFRYYLRAFRRIRNCFHRDSRSRERDPRSSLDASSISNFVEQPIEKVRKNRSRRWIFPEYTRRDASWKLSEMRRKFLEHAVLLFAVENSANFFGIVKYGNPRRCRDANDVPLVRRLARKK